MAEPNRAPLPVGPYLVVGLARSGIAAALALRRANPVQPVVACDTGDGPDLRRVAKRLGEAGVEVELGTDGVDALASTDPPRTVVKSPGVPAQAPVIAQARRLGLDVLGELELGWRLLPNSFCAVTGTNGKTTTTEMIGAIYRAANEQVSVAGNVGLPLSSLPGEIERSATIVCEVSSFQLEDSISFRPEVGVLLNITPDHIDRHQTIEGYRDAKLRLLSNQTFSDFAVLNADDSFIATNPIPGEAERIWFGSTEGCDLRVHGGRLNWREEPLMDVDQLALRGPHNLENAMAAAAATLVDGVGRDAVIEALSTFKAVEHRLELVATIAGVGYVNDSKATNVAAASAALRSFEPGSVHAILGGSVKGGDFSELAPVVAERCAACYLVGEATEQLSSDLTATGVELIVGNTIDRAVAEASERASSGQSVLLSPACASFDQFDNYEQRGEHFRSLVQRLRQQT